MLLYYEVQEYGLADGDLPAFPLPTVRVPLYHRASPGTIGCNGRATPPLLPSLAPSVGSGPRRGLDGLFESGRQGLPNWDCAAEAHFKRDEDRVNLRCCVTISREQCAQKPRNHYNVSQKDSSLSQ
jgi:hypothetical protein